MHAPPFLKKNKKHNSTKCCMYLPLPKQKPIWRCPTFLPPSCTFQSHPFLFVMVLSKRPPSNKHLELMSLCSWSGSDHAATEGLRTIEAAHVACHLKQLIYLHLPGSRKKLGWIDEQPYWYVYIYIQHTFYNWTYADVDVIFVVTCWCFYLFYVWKRAIGVSRALEYQTSTSFMVNVRWRHVAGICEYSVPKNQRKQKRSLVGGFNPSQKYQSKWNSSPSRGENNKCLKPPPRFLTRHHGKHHKTSFLATNFLQPGPQPKTHKKSSDIAFWALPCLPNNSPVADHNSSLKSSSKEFSAEWFGHVCP